MTGWELADPAQALLENSPELRDFLARYPLASLNPEGDMCVILRRCCPGLNLPPEGAESELQIHLFFVGAWMRYPLPQSVVFRRVESRGRRLHFDTDQGLVATNVSQLNKLMEAQGESQLREVFLSLQDVLPPPRRPITTVTLQSCLLGQMRSVDFPDWWQGQSLAIPYFGGQTLPVIFTNLHPDEDIDFVREADEALTHFLGQRKCEQATSLVLANCRQFLEAIGEEDRLAQLPDEASVWTWVEPGNVYLSRRTRGDAAIYLQITCQCHWDEEHGLQLVFRKGRDLIRVSSEDGHLTDSDAYDLPDQEDPLLAPVLAREA